MTRTMFRLALLVAGMAVVEIGLGDALLGGSLAAWALVVLAGLPLIIAGTAGFMVPLLGARTRKDGSNDA